MIKRRLKTVFILTMALLMSVPAVAKKKELAENDMGAYLMVYHKDETHGLYMAVSYGGRSFTALNGD